MSNIQRYFKLRSKGYIPCEAWAMAHNEQMVQWVDSLIRRM